MERILKKSFILSLLAVLALAFTAVRGESTTLLPLTMDDLLTEADHIVLGTVVAKHSEWHVNYQQGRSLLYTVYTLDVEQALKGESGGSIEFRVVGGEDESCFLQVPGAPHFEIGERAVLFLRSPIPDSITDVIGMEQGKFAVVDETVVDNGMRLDTFLSFISRHLEVESD